jgi:RNA polymerase sigma factor (sigma-70 family)
MAAAQDGDRRAYERLLREIVPFIRGIVARQHGTSERIDEVLQEVLLTVHRVRHTYDPQRPFEYWLAAITRRRSIDLLRRRFRTERIETQDEIAYETFADPLANQDLERRAAGKALGEAIGTLPKLQREAVELLKLREMSLSEASRASGRSVAALKVNMHRALKSLRQRIGGE